jgi:hypothetical protein
MLKQECVFCDISKIDKVKVEDDKKGFLIFSIFFYNITFFKCYYLRNYIFIFLTIIFMFNYFQLK